MYGYLATQMSPDIAYLLNNGVAFHKTTKKQNHKKNLTS